jgi:hypothetical protein
VSLPAERQARVSDLKERRGFAGALQRLKIQTISPLKLLLHSKPQALHTQSFSTMRSRRYVDTMGAIAGRSQFGHRIRAALMVSTALGA